MKDDGPILRVFEVEPKVGCVDVLLSKFAIASAQVVDGEPGNSIQVVVNGRRIEGRLADLPFKI